VPAGRPTRQFGVSAARLADVIEDGATCIEQRRAAIKKIQEDPGRRL
jgi:hypothetical protein